jgi:hypothetical protein
MTLKTFTLTFTADVDDEDNLYHPDFSDDRNIDQAMQRGHIQPGISVYLELGTGDVVKGDLASITAEPTL